MRPTVLGVLVAATLALSACASGSSPSARPAATAPGVDATPPVTAITIATDPGTELRFDPGEVTVQPGIRIQVTFENRSELPHDLTFGAPINVASSPVVAPGTSETLEFVAPEPGTYAFACTIHPGMGGTLIVAAS
ncbi:MAG TPA: cupredoxin domain-containing protein [Candidatus Limnocylindrales bacterium]|nr:cupredoxin domain-containing protein [Candidatus Limnocylindrales bacterium]